jgi:trans-2,3-dihydro-3-hydroxyanthranilate isomerase
VPLEYVHVDVFAPAPFRGNSLAVFPNVPELTPGQMLRITQELRHFETIFLQPLPPQGPVGARVFDLLQELGFAGHPVIGAAAVLHRLVAPSARRTWHISLPAKTVSVDTEATPSGVYGLLDQGGAQFLGIVHERDAIACAFDLSESDLDARLPVEVVSTGLRYLIVPVAPGALAKACIRANISQLLAGVEAEFAVLLDEQAVEVRHWNNDGVVEDVATGSAAGTIGAYRVKHGLCPSGVPFELRQGRFTGRPSILRVQADDDGQDIVNVKVGGDVAFVANGRLEALP